MLNWVEVEGKLWCTCNALGTPRTEIALRNCSKWRERRPGCPHRGHVTLHDAAPFIQGKFPRGTCELLAVSILISWQHKCLSPKRKILRTLRHRLHSRVPQGSDWNHTWQPMVDITPLTFFSFLYYFLRGLSLLLGGLKKSLTKESLVCFWEIQAKRKFTTDLNSILQSLHQNISP